MNTTSNPGPLTRALCTPLLALWLACTAPLQAQITTLATFNGASNGAHPFCSLTLSGSTLYGTTDSGGADGDGTVFSVPVGGGSVTTLATFAGASNGANPYYDSLTLSGSTLYGTTENGGPNNGAGTVFSVPVGGGSVTTLASFNNVLHGGGESATGSLTLSGSTLYGTTENGGTNSDGTVFSLPVGGGSVTTLANFAGLSNGTNPFGSLTLIGNTLYGTTAGGGANGYGTVFSVPVTGGPVTTLASFVGGSNGGLPEGSLTLIGSTLYGTTKGGDGGDFGTVFSVPVTGGSVTTLASFTNGEDPTGSLTLSGSTLYGTTVGGGANDDGTVFSLPVGGGAVTTLASFAGASNGQDPRGSLTLIGSTLYGTTADGGANGYGTAFSVPTPEPGSATLAFLGGLGLLARRRTTCGARSSSRG